MSQRVYLIVKRRDPGSGEARWALPETAHEPGELLRDTALRSVGEQCGATIWNAIYSTGRAPVGFDWEKSSGGDFFGAKTFFFPGQIYDVTEMELTLGDEVTDHAWVTRDEIPEYLGDTPRTAHLQKLIN